MSRFLIAAVLITGCTGPVFPGEPCPAPAEVACGWTVHNSIPAMRCVMQCDPVEHVWKEQECFPQCGGEVVLPGANGTTCHLLAVACVTPVAQR